MKRVSLQLIVPCTRQERKIDPHISSSLLCPLILGLFLCVCMSGCTEQTTRSASEPLVIACTIPPQEEFIRAVAGDYPVSVLVMVPPGANPHTYEPTPSQIAQMESANLYLALGSGIEFENRWLSQIRSMYPNLSIIMTAEQIDLIPADHLHEEHEDPQHHDEQGMDPHVWLSLENTARIVNKTADAMVHERPYMRDVFYANRDRYTSQLFEVDHTIRSTLKSLQNRAILVYHPAFGYFCRDYNLTQIAIEENGREPSAQHLAAIITQAQNEGIRLIFAEPESSTKQAETLARELNGTVVLISPLAGNYLENMQRIADHIAASS